VFQLISTTGIVQHDPS